jgi:hypothetical protein
LWRWRIKSPLSQLQYDLSYPNIEILGYVLPVSLMVAKGCAIAARNEWSGILPGGIGESGRAGSGAAVCHRNATSGCAATHCKIVEIQAYSGTVRKAGR